MSLSCSNYIYLADICPQVDATHECHHNGGVYCAASCPSDAPVQLSPFDCPVGCVCCSKISMASFELLIWNSIFVRWQIIIFFKLGALSVKYVSNLQRF